VVSPLELAIIVLPFDLHKNHDNNVSIDGPDSLARFHLTDFLPGTDREEVLSGLQRSWSEYHTRDAIPESEWVRGLEGHLEGLANNRVSRVSDWVSINTSRFTSKEASFDSLKRLFDNTVVDLKANIQMCKMTCISCHLICLRVRHHDGHHDCSTSHECLKRCGYSNEHEEEATCGLK
jgi:hypothetical protein